ncbi:MAG: GAF domain-containing protein [Candidatus Omnitrophica bacterium]|nr:GAF domain-containing protein [Candidatus Omnitrophota bacterium]
MEAASVRESAKNPFVSDREIYEELVRHEGLRKLRPLFDPLLGHAVWWIAPRAVIQSRYFNNVIESSYEIWHDPRLRKVDWMKHLPPALKGKHVKYTTPYELHRIGARWDIHVPLLAHERVIGYAGLVGLKSGVSHEVLNALTGYIRLLLDNCFKAEEINRLSAAIRPRAIALSTVHTVHRIINSTLNLDELLTRLAHLTTQVMRANRCAIYLAEKPLKPASPSRKQRGPKTGCLICKSLVGYPKKKERDFRIAFGGGVEGQVAQTAQIVRRKKFICVPLIDEDVIGVVKVSDKRDKKEFAYFDQEILTTLAEEAVIAIKNAELYEEQKKVTLSTIQALAVILGTQVPSAASADVFLKLALEIAHEMKLSDEDVQALHYATLLKETARVGIPPEILHKPAKLTGEEYRLLREHPIKGAKIVQSFQSLRPVVPIILYSREKYDGTGYPKGLKGEKIPVGARILSVINAFEAILMGRPYRGRLSLREALDEIQRNSGTQFDPKVVDAFVHVVEREGFKRLLKSIGMEG